MDKLNLYASVLKNVQGKYKAILSDDSIDRQDEIVGKSFLEGALTDKTFGLLDHENKVENRVCDWVNKRMEVIDGHNALVAEPKFFLSNPRAKMIKGMLDDGAELGISIGAIPLASDTTKINEKQYKRYTKGTIIEASFVGIPANANAGIETQTEMRNAHVSNIAIAKSLNYLDLKKTQSEEEITMKKTNEELVEKAKEIVELSGKALDNESIEKLMKVSDIPEEVYKDLMPEEEQGEPANAGNEEPAKEPTDKNIDPKKQKKEDEDDKDNKSLSEADVQKMVDDQVQKKMEESPIFKAQADMMKMTEEEQVDKATELQKSGMLPINN